MKKEIPAFMCIVLLLLCCLSACGNKKEKPKLNEVVQGEVQSETDESKDESAAELVQEGETGAQLPKYRKTPSGDTTADENINQSDFSIILEAEEAQKAGKVKAESKKKGFSGTGYVIGIENPSDTIAFTVSIPESGAYDLNFISASYSGYKENNISVDGDFIGIAKTESEDFSDSILKKVFITKGEHVIKMTKNWGWIYLDALEITASEPADPSMYQVKTELADRDATENTRRLMNYLADMYGKYIISGQYGDRGIEGSEFKAIKQATEKYPAILGLDFIEYTPSRVAHGSVGKDVQYAVEFDKLGGIVTFCWHWNAPQPYLVNTLENPWWSGFYTRATNICLKDIISGADQNGYDLLLKDIDAIAAELKKLQEADIPILWRPLHEASGGWFWWGDSGPEPYIQLYRLLFERLTIHHQIHNLIWVWNGQDKSWYPGDEYVDIAGMDIYPGERVYSPQTPRFNDLVEWVPDRMIALTENGCLFDPDLALRDNAMWAYFGTWEGEFVTMSNTVTLSEKYTEKDMVKKVYTHEKVITLDELPDLKTYRLD